NNWTYSYGYSLQHVLYDNNTLDLVNSWEFNSDLRFLRYGAYAQASSNWLDDRLQLSAGFRIDDNSFMTDNTGLFAQFSPRLSASYTLDRAGKVKWNQSWGIYYKIPPYTVLGYQDNLGLWVNQSSKYIESEHLVGGLEFLINESARMTLEGFLKRYNNYPVSIKDEVSLANKGGGFEVLGSEPILSTGLGRTYGVEFLYQQKFTGTWYGIGSLTWYRSEFSGSNEIYQPSLWDNQLLISLLGGYKLGNNWEISTRYRYLGSAPYVPTNSEKSLQFYPAIVKDFNNIGSVRLDSYNQVDVRVDKKWSYRNWSLDLFFEIQNVLANANPQEPSYGLDRNEAGEILLPRRLVQVNTNNSATVLPSIGIVINF
ncbi:MAG: TonB-dependent receptor, partial [Bacteroidota bacterium]